MSHEGPTYNMVHGGVAHLGVPPPWYLPGTPLYLPVYLRAQLVMAQNWVINGSELGY